MSEFIRFATAEGVDMLLRIDSIFCIQGKSDTGPTYVYAQDAGGNEEMFTVNQGIDEIQAALDNKSELVPRQPVQRPRRDDGEFRI